MRRISSRQNPVVDMFRAAAQGDASAILLDGEHLVDAALTARCRLSHVVVALDRVSRPTLASLIERVEDPHTEIIEATAPVMAAVSPVRSASAIVALADRPDCSAALHEGSAPLLVVACDVQDPGNLGAVIRVAEAAGGSGVVVAGQSADPFGWKALRGSMGSALRLPIVRSPSVEHAIDDARSHGYRIVATVPRGGVPFFDSDLRRPTAVLIGGEGQGLTEAVLAGADEQITIPMTASVESLNAAVAAALMVYEARRQRS